MTLKENNIEINLTTEKKKENSIETSSSSSDFLLQDSAICRKIKPLLKNKSPNLDLPKLHIKITYSIQEYSDLYIGLKKPSRPNENSKIREVILDKF